MWLRTHVFDIWNFLLIGHEVRGDSGTTLFALYYRPQNFLIGVLLTGQNFETDFKMCKNHAAQKEIFLCSKWK